MHFLRRNLLNQALSIYRFVHFTANKTPRQILNFPQNHLNPKVTTFQIQAIRHYAKGKDKKKEVKKPGKVEINEDFLRKYISYDVHVSNLEKHLVTMKEEYIKNLSLRSTTGSMETLLVNVDGKDIELQELAQIVRKNPKTIIVNMINFPQTIPNVLQAIKKSGMNLNPQQDGTTLFIPIPKVTKEHRENLAKNAKTLYIKCRDSIKESQNLMVKKLKKQDKVPEDDLHMCQNQLTALSEKFIEQADKLLDAKSKELLGGE